MKRNPILVLGLGVLLSFGVFAVGCGDDAAPKKNDGSADATKRDTGSTGGSIATGGAKGTGGATGAGGVTGTGGVTGVGGVTGTGGATGVGGVTGTGGATGAGGVDGGPRPDGARDVVQGEAGKDSPPDQPIKTDTILPDGGPVLDVQGVDVTPVSLDTALDQPVDTAALDTAAIEVQIDSGVDSGIDTI